MTPKFSRAWTPGAPDELEDRARSGDATATTLVGEGYKWGDWGFRRHREKGLEWIRRGVSAGEPMACYIILLERHVRYQEGGDLEAHFGNAHRLRVAWQEAFSGLVAREVVSENPHVWFLLGDAYSLARGTPKDPERAMEWFMKAAQAGHTRAMCRIGSILTRQHSPETWADGQEWYRTAAELGCANGMVFTGFCKREGTGTAPDQEEAAMWFEQAFHAGDDHAAVHAGRQHAWRLSDWSKAVEWFERGAEADQKESFVELGILRGNPKLPVYDPSEAARWYEKVIEAGGSSVWRAHLALAQLYRDGQGVERNLANARAHLEAIINAPGKNGWRAEAEKTLSELDQSLL